jgi:hypothetical protein
MAIAIEASAVEAMMPKAGTWLLDRSYAWRRLVYALTWEFVLLRWRLVSTSWSG